MDSLVARYTAQEYDKLLDLCAALTRAWEKPMSSGGDSFDYVDAVEAISEYTQSHHPDWQG